MKRKAKASVTVSFRWPPEIKDAMERRADQERRSMNNQVLLAVREHLEGVTRPYLLRKPRKPWLSKASDGKPVHVYPLDDLKAHTLSGRRCWCKPQVIQGVIVHNAADGREEIETGERRVS